MPNARKCLKRQQTQRSDRISDLPPDVVEKIFMRLPTKDAARTSILSRKWRYRWATVPHLILDDTLWKKSVGSQTSVRTKFTAATYQILSARQGPIRKCTLSISGLESCPEIDSLIMYLSRSNVEKFTLKIWLGVHYIMPSSFFSCPNLKHMNLHSCLVKPPHSFKGFGQLTRLKLVNVDIADKVLERLISSCPLLEQLQLDLAGTIDYLEVIAPMLKVFLVDSCIKAILFRNTPVLARVGLYCCRHSTDFRRAGEDIIQHFGRLSSLENLLLDNYFIRSLAVGGVPMRFAADLPLLKRVDLFGVNLAYEDHVSFILCLIRSSPNLHDIEMFLLNGTADVGSGYQFLVDQDYSDLKSNQLAELKLKNFSGSMIEIVFLKMLLGTLPKLERLQIELDYMWLSVGAENVILKKLLRFPRASTSAEVIICEDPE